MMTLIFVYIIEEVAHAHAQNAPLEHFFVNIWAGSPVQAVKQDLLVVYPVIAICGYMNARGLLSRKGGSCSN